MPFPPNNFKYFLTLFSKFFSSFPRGTCSLSVSYQYLALDGIYHQIWAAFSNNPTLGKHSVGYSRLGSDFVDPDSRLSFWEGQWADRAIRRQKET